MTDLPADPSAWDLHDDPLEDRAGTAPPLTGVPVDATERGRVDNLPVPIVYDTLDTFTSKVSWRALLWPLAAVVAVSVVLGLVMARGGDDKAASSTASSTATASSVAVATGATTSAPATSAATTVAPTTAPATTAPVTTVAPTTAAPTTTATTVAPTTTTATTAAPAPSVPPSTEAPPDQGIVGGVDLSHPVRWAEFTGGKVYLHGRVPSAELAATIIAKVAGVVGKDNVVVDYVVDPTAPAVAGGPLNVTDTVQFESGSAVVRPAFRGILDLGAALMTQNPSVRIIVIGRADPRGGADYNQRLSEARSQAVVEYIAAQGIDRSRLTIDARGDSDPLVVGDDDAANAANRSVEFIVLGLID